MNKVTRARTGFLAFLGSAAFLANISPVQATQFWRTDGTTGGVWSTSAFWSAAPSPTGGSTYVANSDAEFSANSSLTFGTVSIGNVTVDDGVTVTITKGGTLSTGGNVRTVTVGTGSLLTWTSQTVTATSAAGFTKAGPGTWDLGAMTFTTTMNGGFTLNAGTVIASGNKSFGNGTMTINGGTLQTSGGITPVVTSLTIGGDFELKGTGNDVWNVPTHLGASTRTITNSTSSGANRTFAGVIDDTSGTTGLVFTGTGAGLIVLTNTSNSYGGGTTFSGAEVSISTLLDVGPGNLTFTGGILQVTGSTLTTVDSRIANPTSFSGGFDVGSGFTSGSPFTVGVALSGGGFFTKAGAGTLSTNVAHSYTGPTTITGGTLVLGPSGSVTSSSSIIVGDSFAHNTATLDVSAVSGGFHVVNGQTLAGYGNITGPVTVDTGAHTDPGNTIGTTTYTGTLTYASNAVLDYDFGPALPNHTFIALSSDLVNNTSAATGALTFNGNVTLNLASGSANITGSGSYEIFAFTNASSVSGFTPGDGTTGTIQLGTGFPGGFNYAFSMDPTGIFMDFSPSVPEPASLALLGLGAVGILRAPASALSEYFHIC